MLNKPIARWTLGPVSPVGQEILLESITKFASIYPEFHRVICYNNIESKVVKKFEPYAEIYEQKTSELPCSVMPPDAKSKCATGCGWKFSPPRMRINSLELFLDNDLVIFKRIKEIDDYITSKRHGIISEGKWRLYGFFQNFVSCKQKLCAGFFGLPPFLSFEKHIKYFFSKFNQPLDAFDEQGITAATISSMKNFYVIPVKKLRIVEDHDDFPNLFEEEVCGIHFVGANRKFNKNWEIYKNALHALY
jgi:hypothetical protein